MQYYYGIEDKIAPSTDHTILVVSSKKGVEHEIDHMTIRRFGREDWSLLYCETGAIYFDDSILKPGQVWIYKPRTPQKYKILACDKTQYRFLHFTGSNIPELLSSLKIPIEKTIQIKVGVSELFDKIEAAANENDYVSQINAESLTLRLLAHLAIKSNRKDMRNMMSRIIDEMTQNYMQPFEAEKYASMLNLSESRFNHLFKETVGLSPKNFYINIRLENACKLLEFTDMKINEISETVGYTDSLYFGKLFTQKIGLSPSLYRASFLSKQ